MTKQEQACACGHGKEQHPMGMSENILLIGTCMVCGCREFTTADAGLVSRAAPTAPGDPVHSAGGSIPPRCHSDTDTMTKQDDQETALVPAAVPTRLSDAWVRLNAFYVMGGFKLENLTEAYQESFREAQQAFITAVRDATVAEVIQARKALP